MAEKSIAWTAPNGKTVNLRTQAFINNKYVDAVGGKTFDTVNPSDEKVIAAVASCEKADVDLAVKAARDAFENHWSKTTGAQRAALLNKLADVCEKHAEEMCIIEVADNGKPYTMYAGVDWPLCVSHLRYFAGWADKITGATMSTPGTLLYTRKEPVGVAGQIIPWNFPMLMFMWKIAPALAAGCTIVMKPAEQTPLGALRMGDLLREAGFPPGVVNIVPGLGHTAGAAVASHPDIDKVAFTGSTEVGRLIMKAAAESNLKKVTLELGGKSPVIVAADADVDEAVNLTHMGIFFNQGQVCTASSRIYVHESLYDSFVAKATAAAKARVAVTGDPFHPDTQQGAQVSEEQYHRIMSYIDIGKRDNKLACGGVRKGDKGFFIEPTIFTEVEKGHKIHDEEIFGPVMSVIRFKDLSEAIKKANDSSFGLAAAVLTKDIKTAFNTANALKAGTIWVNTYHRYDDCAPFGGYKQSGIGREKGAEALDNYLQVKTVFVNIAE